MTSDSQRLIEASARYIACAAGKRDPYLALDLMFDCGYDGTPLTSAIYRDDKLMIVANHESKSLLIKMNEKKWLLNDSMGSQVELPSENDHEEFFEHTQKLICKIQEGELPIIPRLQLFEGLRYVVMTLGEQGEESELIAAQSSENHHYRSDVHDAYVYADDKMKIIACPKTLAITAYSLDRDCECKILNLKKDGTGFFKTEDTPFADHISDVILESVSSESSVSYSS